MCGIFAYLNYQTPKTRREIIDLLIKGLQRLEYRGYDSAGLAVDGGDTPATQNESVLLLKKSGKVKALETEIWGKRTCAQHSHFPCTDNTDINMDVAFDIHCGIAHTRWATHGPPNWLNSHPQRSDVKAGEPSASCVWLAYNFCT
jgi:glucosamine--fructose-6-phosphate aminotransferase (isomerizing)